MSDFTHLHVHSHYSLLDGLGKVPDLLHTAKDMGMEAMALTDHGAMYGAIEFVRTAQEIGIKPIVGVEAYLAPNGRTQKRGKIDSNPRHLTLLAQNMQGYKNLLQLVTKANLEGYYYKPRIDYEILETFSEGLVVLSGCMNSDISRAIIEKRRDDAKKLIEWHINVFGPDRFYLEVQDHPHIPEQGILNEELFTFAKEYNLEVAATCDSHYIKPDDAEAQDVLLCVQTNKKVQQKDRMSMLGEDFSLKSPEDLKQAWGAHPEVLDTTLKIADSCNLNIEFGVNRLPRYPLPKDQSADGYLRQLCEAALPEKYDENMQTEAKRRLDYELSVIAKTGYASYFLIVADFVNEAKRRGILVGPGRGSAAGSLVAYMLNITGIDPLHYSLLFERFLNPERVSMPDIDLDFADDRRDEVIDYVREKYGHEHVAQIITFGTMAARAAVRDAGRALDFPYAFCDSVAKAIPMFTDFEEALSGGELKDMYDSDPQVRRLVDTARKLEGVCRHASTHAAGVVITEDPLTEYVPLQIASTGDSSEDDTVTQYAMNEVEALGLLKMDFLGLKNLTIIQNALHLIRDRHKLSINIENLPLDDALTYELLQSGMTTGVFQLESAGMKRYLKELKPTEFEDIISMVALYRPGPMDSIPDFIAAKHGKKKVEYLHPTLKPILEKTYGVIVTQDQVLQIAREFSGFSYAEADILRKAVGKKIKELLDEQRNKFVAGAIEHTQVTKETAVAVWDFIEPFARYGFNRAHAACYAMIAYQTAYLKANYPAEFMAALLTSDEGNTERQAVEVAEALNMKLPVLGPDINESGHDFTVVQYEGKDAIRFGLNAVKNVGHNVVRSLIAERDEHGFFSDLTEVFRRINSKDFNRKSVESLAKSGAFDCVAERNHVLHNLERLLEFNRRLHKKSDTGQQGLFGEESTVTLADPRIELEEVAQALKDEKLGWEKELLGLYLSEHPLSEFQDQLQTIATPLPEISALKRSGGKVRVAGVVAQIKKIVTKSQQPMLFVGLEDLTSRVEVLVFPSILEKTGELWQDGTCLLIEGKLSDKDDEAKVLADKVWKITGDSIGQLAQTLQPIAVKKQPQPLHTAHLLSIRLRPTLSKDQLEVLRMTLEKHRASDDSEGVAVQLLIPRNGHVETVKMGMHLKRDTSLVDTLSQVVGAGSIRFS